MVDLIRRYSNQDTLTTTLDRLHRETADQGTRSHSPAPQPHALRHHLPDDDKSTILADYEAGTSTKQLAAKYKLGKGTVLDILHTGGATIREQRHLTTAEIDYAITRYNMANHSLASVSASASPTPPSAQHSNATADHDETLSHRSPWQWLCAPKPD